MFIWINGSEKVYFTSARADRIDYVLTLFLLSGEKYEETFMYESQLDDRLEEIKSTSYTEVNSNLIKLSEINECISYQDIPEPNLVYITKRGSRVVEKFTTESARDLKVDSLKTFKIKVPIEPAGPDDYRLLTNKPSINGVELLENILTEDLGITTSELINDAGFIDKNTDNLVNYYDRTYIDEKLRDLSGIPVREGTETRPVIASELDTGLYVISGIVQSSRENTTSRTVNKRTYSVWKDEEKVVFWQEDPVCEIKYYIVFDIEGTDEPISGNTRMVSEEFLRDYVANAVIDAGEI